ncbi:MAG: MFS transporter [Candidatus Omnitrophica bacterium]|nr:MFS transporter [Candidatus Omnitrophota bacterium]MDD5236320.1 MFS transporter [Candidatus Omnitrophota bacterium]MDD5610809.1 MFS transporter [Candidatus Omnitrophota bacterium]
MFNIIILGITSFLTDISSEMIYPLLPIYLVNHLGASPAILGLIEGIAESTASLAKVFIGFFSDRLKQRRSFAILGYGFSAIGKFFLYISGTWGMVFAARFIDRLGKGIRTAPRDALIADSSGEKRRGFSFGLHRTMDTVGAALGVLLAIYFIQHYQGDFKKVFLFSLIPAVLGVMVLFKVREKPPENKSPAVKQGFSPAGLIRSFRALDRRLKFFLLITLIFNLGNSSNQFLLLRAKNLGFSLVSVVVMYLVYNITYALTSYPAGRISDIIGRKKILVAGYLFYGLVYFGFARAIPADNFIWFLFGLYGFYMGFTDGIEKAFISDIAPLDSRATLIGLHATLAGIALLPASLVAGILWKTYGPAVPFWFGGAMGILASISLAIFI